MRSWWKDNHIEIYSTHNEGKSIVAEKFMKILENKIYKYMMSVSKNVYIDKLYDIVNKYNNAYHNTIQMKLANVKPRTYIDFDKDSNKKDLKFEVDDHVKISKYKNILAKDYVQNWSEEVSMIKKVKITVP